MEEQPFFFQDQWKSDQPSSQKSKATPVLQGSGSQPAKSSSARVEQTLRQAGATQPPGPELGTILRRKDAKERKAVDYWHKAFYPLTLGVAQPGGGHLKAAPLQPRTEWAAENHITQVNLMVHIQALAHGGRQHSEYRTHDHSLQDWDDCLQQLHSSQKALQRLHREEAHVDEVHVGAILVTVHALQTRRDELKKEVAELNQNQVTWRKQLKDTWKATVVHEDHAFAGEQKLEKTRDALHRAQAERDEGQAVYQKALSEST